MAYFMGLDVGSRTCKGVIIQGGHGVVASHSLPQGTNYSATVDLLRDRMLSRAGLTAEDMSYVVSTGHPARASHVNEYVTDLRCCAQGVYRTDPSVRTVIDIQAQTSQVLRLSPSGLVSNFVISEKCAAGSGRFLDVIANVLRVGIEELGRLAASSVKPVSFSTGCAVFGESEAISRVAEGMPREDIIAGVHESIADKISALISRIGMEEPCAIVGGGALNTGLVKSISRRLGIAAVVPEYPEMMGALGAAAIAEAKCS